MKIREQQRINRKKEIKSCCLDLFISRGYSGTGIRDIAKDLDIATGVFFNYYESKEKIYYELISEAVDGQNFIEKMLESKDNPIKTLKEVAEKVLCVFKENALSRKLYVLMLQAFWSKSTPESIKSLIVSYDLITPTAALIKEGQSKGQIRNGDPLALSAAFWSAMQGIALNKTLSPRLPFPESEWIISILKP